MDNNTNKITPVWQIHPSVTGTAPNSSDTHTTWSLAGGYISDFVLQPSVFPQPVWREIDQLFDKFWKSFPEPVVVEDTKFPKCNAWADESGLHIHLAVPYARREDLDVEIDSRLRKVAVKCNAHQEQSDIAYLKREISRTSFSRTFIIGQEFDLPKTEVKLENGLLIIDIPVSDEELKRFKKVEIK